MSRDVHAELARAQAAADDAYYNGPHGNPVYRATPGCTRLCPQCDIRCAILQGELYDLERKIAGMPPSLQWGGLSFPEVRGRA